MRQALAAIFLLALSMGAARAEEIRMIELPPPQTAESDAIKRLIEEQVAKGEAEQPPTDPELDWQLFSAEAWLDGVPDALSYEPTLPAINALRYPGALQVKAPERRLPTRYEFNNGSVRANFSTNVTTASTNPTVVPTSAYAGAVPLSGGSGEFKGRLEYDYAAWQFYGGTTRSLIANGDGTLGLGNTVAAGTYYSLPPNLLGGKVGTGLEFSPEGNATTRLEYRKKFGTAEGFIAAERSVPFDHFLQSPADPVNALKAGINRKF